MNPGMLHSLFLVSILLFQLLPASEQVSLARYGRANLSRYGRANLSRYGRANLSRYGKRSEAPEGETLGKTAKVEREEE